MRFLIPIDVFDMAVYFFFGEEEEKRFLKETGLDNVNFGASGFTANNATWIKDDNDMNTIIHESYHLVKFIVDMLGIKDQETEAYMLTYIVQSTVNKIRKIKSREKKGANND
jgi:hypothetical protein